MITIRYGIARSVERSFAPGYTIQDLLNDMSLLAALGAPEGCNAVSSGEILNPQSSVASYSVITLEKKASSKA
jgi:hypothetical protein